MKKIIALLTSLFISLFNNVEFTTAPDRTYTADSYYKVSEAEPPDYRNIYEAATTASGKDNCKTTNFSSRGKMLNYPDGTGSSVIKGFWLANCNTGSYSFSSVPDAKEYVFTDSGYIIAPYDCELMSKSSTNSGHDMVVKFTLGDNVYRLTYSNMERWYCCCGKTPNTDESELVNYQWVHDSEEQEGHIFKQGNVLGKSVAGQTKVIVVKLNGNSEGDCTFKQMYLNQ